LATELVDLLERAAISDRNRGVRGKRAQPIERTLIRMHAKEHCQYSDDASAKAKRVADESFDKLPFRPLAVDHGIVNPSDIRNEHRLSGPRHMRQLSFGIQRNPVVRAVDPAPICSGFPWPSSARAHVQRVLLSGSSANGAVPILVEKPNPSQGNVLVGHDGFDYLPEDGRGVCRLSD
jgi:hypothetical protein